MERSLTVESTSSDETFRVSLADDGTWMVEGDIDGDGIADFLIQVTSTTPLTAADFVL